MKCESAFIRGTVKVTVSSRFGPAPEVPSDRLFECEVNLGVLFERKIFNLQK